jgi:RNA polymerase sigma factor
MANINQSALKAKNDETEFERLLTEYKPFIASCASKACGHYVDEHDDEMSIAIIAFAEAVRRFEPDSSGFLKFSSNVIRCRIIDHLREAGRYTETESLDAPAYDEDGESAGDKIQYKHLTLHPNSKFDDPVKMEIEMLTQDLKKYGILFMDLPNTSPKSIKTKEACIQTVRALISNDYLLGEMKRTRLLPVSDLEIISRVSRKTIARHRSYIVCLAEIISGDYNYLNEYVKNVKESGKS